MLSVKPGRLIAGTGVLEVPLVVCAMASVELSMSATEFPEGLKIMENFKLGETAISPGCALLPAKEMRDGDSTSFEASTMFSTGEFPAPLGKSGFETKTRNLRPLTACVVLEELLFPQEIIVTLAVTSANIVIKVLLKLGTPKSVKDRDLDARKRIITERLPRILSAGGVRLPPRCKSHSPLVF